MKRIILFGLVIIMSASCTDLAQDEISSVENVENKLASSKIDFLDFENEIELYRKQNQTRLANSSHLKKGCDSNVRVPFDFPTIQEAVDNVCDGGNVMVSSGSYTERVFITKPGVKLKAIGQAELIGGFVIFEEADDVVIQNFKISVYERYSGGIIATRADRLTISQNEINSDVIYEISGIALHNSSRSTIHKNKITGTLLGIRIIGGVNYAPEDNVGLFSNNNDVSNNFISGFNRGGIILEGRTQANSIKNNTIINSWSTFRRSTAGGILINYWETYSGISHNNEVKNNKSVDVEVGIYIDNNSSGNKILGNEFLNNNRYGIYVPSSLVSNEPNIFKNNKVHGNSICDIFDSSNLNIYSNNRAGCVSGI